MLDQKILVTGASGFIGQNLIWQLSDKYPSLQFIETNSWTSNEELEIAVGKCDLIFHFAGANRPSDGDFSTANEELTAKICNLSAHHGGKEIVFASSIHADGDSDYGLSKKNCEHILTDYQKSSKNRVHILRLPGVFGKWSKPNYNSVVATFCYKIARNEDIYLHDGNKFISVLYIDDLVQSLELYISGGSDEIVLSSKIQKVRLKDLAQILNAFSKGPHACFERIINLDIDKKLIKNLHSTYVSFIPDELINFPLSEHKDVRGVFCEIMRELPFGQLSFVTVSPGTSRGGHYHHSKVELFVVVSGEILFQQMDVRKGSCVEYSLGGGCSTGLYTKPGCLHVMYNNASEPAVVLIWTNESFDQSNHDTYFMKEK